MKVKDLKKLLGELSNDEIDLVVMHEDWGWSDFYLEKDEPMLLGNEGLAIGLFPIGEGNLNNE